MGWSRVNETKSLIYTIGGVWSTLIDIGYNVQAYVINITFARIDAILCALALDGAAIKHSKAPCNLSEANTVPYLSLTYPSSPLHDAISCLPPCSKLHTPLFDPQAFVLQLIRPHLSILCGESMHHIAMLPYPSLELKECFLLELIMATPSQVYFTEPINIYQVWCAYLRMLSIKKRLGLTKELLVMFVCRKILYNPRLIFFCIVIWCDCDPLPCGMVLLIKHFVKVWPSFGLWLFISGSIEYVCNIFSHQNEHSNESSLITIRV